MLPKVIIHIAVSLDGRIEGFKPDIGKYYELAATWNEDATLVGSNTILKGTGDLPKVDEDAVEPPKVDSSDPRPLMIIPDSTGRVRVWNALRATPYWKDGVALCSYSTPKEYLLYLKERHIKTIVKGKDKVDLKSALEELCTDHGIRTVRVDSGGILNGVLLRARLVDEVSVLVHPNLVGGMTQSSFFKASDLRNERGVIDLRLFHLERLRKDLVWLRYKVKS